jgi:phospholipid/cholesterol/gamma-HCH transport system substrate-binding protein
MTGSRSMIVKFGIFAVVMVLLTVFLFFTFAQVRTGSTNGYSAVFADASRLKTGDTVRIAGIRVGTVRDVALQSDKNVIVDFDADPTSCSPPAPRRRCDTSTSSVTATWSWWTGRDRRG